MGIRCRSTATWSRDATRANPESQGLPKEKCCDDILGPLAFLKHHGTFSRSLNFCPKLAWAGAAARALAAASNAARAKTAQPARSGALSLDNTILNASTRKPDTSGILGTIPAGQVAASGIP